MAESSLSLTYEDLRQRVGLFLGYRRGALADDPAWTADQEKDIEDCMRSGLRSVYFPIPLGGRMHDWSFLHPVFALTFASAVWEYDLPDDFGGLEGDLTYSGTNTTLPVSLPVVGEGTIRQKRTESGQTTGQPRLAASRPKKAADALGQRWELVVWPTPDAGTYTAEGVYYVLPEAVGTTRPYPHGGAAHAETFLAACLAAAELFLNGAPGPHTGNFQARLAASMAADRRFKPARLGYNGDASDQDEAFSARERVLLPVKYNGVAY